MAFVKNDEGRVPGLVANLERDLGKALRKTGIVKGPAPILQWVPLQLRASTMRGVFALNLSGTAWPWAYSGAEARP